MAADNRGRRWWASVGIGAVIGVGCCLAPLLAALGIAGSGVALLSVSWIQPLGIALVVVGAAGLIWSRRRARILGCGDRCANTTGEDSAAAPACGCTTTG